MARTKVPRALPIMGWREWAALPDLGVDSIKAKLDTGARSSALHAFDIETYRRRGRTWVRFAVHPVQRSRVGSLTCSALVIDEREIKSSTGNVQRRLVIETHVSIGEHTWPIEVTLARRDQMGFRFLLGRQALARRFLVDPGRSYVGSPGVRTQRRPHKRRHLP